MITLWPSFISPVLVFDPTLVVIPVVEDEVDSVEFDGGSVIIDVAEEVHSW